MAAFAAGETDVLVATTVIEVGIDVANATVMVIEGAERYGVSQLHQLRGRVGRGEHALPLPALRRRSRRAGPAPAGGGRPESDGFKLAEVDLGLRGEGEMLGTRQHGLPRFAVAELPEDTPTLLEAREEVLALLRRHGSPRRPRARAAARRRPPPLRRRRRRPDTGVSATASSRHAVRVIAGELKGSRLVAPRGWKVRPTSDRVREAIFSALGEVEGRPRPRPLLRHRRAGDRGALARRRRGRSSSTATPGRPSATSSALGLGERAELVRADVGRLAAVRRGR